MPRERESKTRGKREKEKEDDHGADEGGKDVNWLQWKPMEPLPTLSFSITGQKESSAQTANFTHKLERNGASNNASRLPSTIYKSIT